MARSRDAFGYTLAVVAGFLLTAVQNWTGRDTPAGDALTVGVIGGMTLGMMTRTARGHTGRALTADRLETLSFLLVSVASLLRVIGGLGFPGAYGSVVVASGICWSAAFALYAALYWSVLSRTRIDGRLVH